MNETNLKPETNEADAEPDREPDFSTGRGHRFLRGVLFLFFLGVCGYTAFSLQHARLMEIANRYEPYIDDLFLPNKEYTKTLAFGYDMFMADFLYVRGIQAFGAKSLMAKEHPKSVYHYFDTITELDPLFFEAYDFGHLVMEEGGQYELAMELGQKGWVNNRNKFQLAFMNGFTAMMKMQKLELGKYWIREALTAPDVPTWVKGWLSDADKKLGLFKLALELRIRDYLASLDSHSHDIMRTITVGQVKETANQWNKNILNEAVRKYVEEKDGKLPASLKELESAGYLDNYLACDYYRTMALVEKDSVAILADLKRAKGIRRFEELMDIVMPICVYETSGVPPSPLDTHEDDDHYFIRKDLKPKDFDLAFEKGVMVMNSLDAPALVETALMFVREKVQEFFKKEKRYPDPLGEAFPEGLDVLDPETGEWNWDYDPKTGEVKSLTYKEL